MTPETVEPRIWSFPPFAAALRTLRTLPQEPTYGIALAFDDPLPLTVLQQLKARTVAIGINGTRQGFEYARSVFARWPELREI